MAFNIPAQTSLSLQRPTTQSAEWVRPASWPTITDDPNKVQFLYADTYPTCSLIADFLRTTASANLYIDWGDGSAPTTQSSADYPYAYTHVYTPGTGATSSLGYTTFVISIFTDESASVITAGPTKPNTPIYTYPTSFLEAYYGDNTYQQNGLSNTGWTGTFKGSTGGVYNNMLQYVKMPRNYPLTNTLDQTFYNCYDLRKVDMPLTMSNSSGLSSTFQNCFKLQSITIPEGPEFVGIPSAFYNCFSLTSINLPNSLPKVTNASSAFFGCTSLSSIQVPSMPNNLTYADTFRLCTSLLNVNIPTWATASSQVIAINTMFYDCNALQNITFPNTLASGSYFTTDNTFSFCSSLTSMVLPEYFNFANGNIFNSCYSISSIVLPTSMPLLNTLAGGFQNCNNLQNIKLPTTVSSSIAMNSAFQSCRSLSNVVIPQSYNITTLSSTFESCRSLNSVSLPTGSQNSCTSIARMFYDCYSLESVTFPSSMTGVTTMAAMFSNAQSLKTALLPTGSMNSCTTANLVFSACYNLENLTFPTSMSACTNFINTWNGCSSLRGNNGSTSSFYLPVSVGNTADFNGAFVTAYELAGVTFNTNQITGSTNSLNNTFYQCSNLKTITNLEKIGSPLATGTLINASTFDTLGGSLSGSLSFTPRLTKLELQGNTTNVPLTGVRLLNSGSSQWTGTSPQINVSSTSLDATALNQLFTDLVTIAGKTINITNCPGAATCNRTIATAKGWTVTG